MDIEANSKTYWLNSLLCLLAGIALPIWANVSRQSLVPVTARVLEYKTNSAPSSASIGNVIVVNLFIELLFEN
jgi:hypothetical protein